MRGMDDKSARTRISLVQRAQDKSDEGAWREFVEIYRNYLYVVVRNMGLPHHDAEEILQIVFTKVWERLPRFQYMPDKGRFRHWLCSICRNSAIDYVRARSSDAKAEGAVAGGAGDFSLPEIDEMAEREWRDFLANLALERAKKDLKPQTIDCFLRFVKGEEPASIAKDLGLAESSIYVYCKRAKDSIRKHLTELERELD